MADVDFICILSCSLFLLIDQHVYLIYVYICFLVGLNRLVKMRKNKKLSKKVSGSKLPAYDMNMAPGKYVKLVFISRINHRDKKKPFTLNLISFLMPFRVFGKPLEQLTSEDEPVPKPINDLLVRLFRYGPSTSGVFRKPPNLRQVKELKEEIDEGLQ